MFGGRTQNAGLAVSVAFITHESKDLSPRNEKILLNPIRNYAK
jgi:hypothetical protein